MTSWLRKTLKISTVPTLSKWNFPNCQQGVVWSTCAWLIWVYSCQWNSEVRATRVIGIRIPGDGSEAQQCMPPHARSIRCSGWAWGTRLLTDTTQAFRHTNSHYGHPRRECASVSWVQPRPAQCSGFPLWLPRQEIFDPRPGYITVKIFPTNKLTTDLFMGTVELFSVTFFRCERFFCWLSNVLVV